MPSDRSFGETVRRYVSLRARAGVTGVEPPELISLMSDLDAFYWKRAEAAVAVRAKENPGALSFSPDERLLIDIGLLDERLLAHLDPKFLQRISQEVNEPGEPNHLYLTEWLQVRHRHYLVMREFGDEGAGAAAAAPEAEVGKDPELREAREHRNRMYRRLGPFFVNLPGVPPKLAKSVLSGAVDDRIEQVLRLDAVGQAASAGRSAEDAAQYDALVNKIFEHVRARLHREEDLKLLDTLRALREGLIQKSVSSAARVASWREATRSAADGRTSATGENVAAFLSREMRLLRSLLRIGSKEGGLAHTCSVLLHDVERTTKAGVARIIERILEANPTIDLSGDLLIAPFTGSGFFEWDRATLIVSLTPARSSEEAVANAAGNYRLLADAMQEDGRIKGAYQTIRPGAGFRDKFLHDYRAWVLQVSRGRREAIDASAYDFFRSTIGPAFDGPVVPAELARLSRREREELAAEFLRLISHHLGTPVVHERLAVLLWIAERIEEAIAHMKIAVEEMPQNGRALYSLALLYRKARHLSNAKRIFLECAQRVPDSIWRIYAHEQLRRLR